MTVTVSLKELLESGAHFGHQTRRWNPKMAEYLYGSQNKVHIFDLVKTKEGLEAALEVLKQYAKEGKAIVLVGTKKQARAKTEEVARDAGVYFMVQRWLGGALTNFDTIKRSLDKLADMKEKRANGEFARFTKKERLLLDREIARLERFFGGIAGLTKLPDLLVIVDTKKESAAVREAIRMGVPVIGIVDSNSDPTKIDYPIPMNDDAVKALDYVLGLMGQAINEGKGKKSVAKPKVAKVATQDVAAEAKKEVEDLA